MKIFLYSHTKCMKIDNCHPNIILCLYMYICEIHTHTLVIELVRTPIHWRKNQGGWGDSCPPSLKSSGAEPP